MRLKLPRTVTAPTQCTSLNGTTQYYNKTSPAGMTFTDDFVVSAWIKVSSYQASTIASRYNGTSGWGFYLESNGTVSLVGYNASASNYSFVVSYQSVPLNKWVHVSAQLDMSAFTVTTTTSYVMFDGVNVPASVIRSGTNPTALVQAGNLEIGSNNGGIRLFPGKIAQVAIYSAKVTQATILASMNQTLTGSETSLVSAYTFNNSINDLSANANNLTAQGSAVATNADTPFTNSVTGTSVTAGTTNYGIIMAQTFSTNTTYTIQIPEGETLPTTGGIGTVSYSTQKTPYGFPGQKGKWTLSLCMGARASTSAGIAANTVTNPGGINLSLPVGEWSLGYQIGAVDSASGPVAYLAFAAGLSTSASSISDYELMSQSVLTNSSNNQIQSYLVKSKQINSTTSTPWYFVVKPLTATVTHTLFTGYDASLSSDIGLITARNAYL